MPSRSRAKAANPTDPPLVLPQKFIIEERFKELEKLKFRESDFNAKIATLEEESRQLQEQKQAILKAIEELRLGLKFESTISAKVFFGQDAAKQSDDNVLLQIRMLEDELHRKKIQWSKLRHGNANVTEDISESRLRKAKCAKVSLTLEEEFREEQLRMEDVLAKSNAWARDVSYLEAKQDEIMNRMETRGVEQKEEQDELMKKLAALREEIDQWDAAEQRENIARTVQESTAKEAAAKESAARSGMSSPRSESGSLLDADDAEREKEAEVLEKYASFTKAFKALMRETGESDIRKIVDIFMQREEDNYALYNYMQRVEHSIQVEERRLAQITQDTQKFLARAEGEVEEGSSLYKRLLRTRDDLVKEVRDSNKQRKTLQRSQRRWHSSIEQFLCLLFGSNFEYKSQLLQTAGVTELILDVKNLLRTKTMFGSSSSSSPSLPSVSTPAILIGESNALLAFAIIEQTAAEIMPAFVDSMRSDDLNSVIRRASMNKFGTRAPAVPRKPTTLEAAAATARYGVVAPELEDVNPDPETLDRARQQAINAAEGQPQDNQGIPSSSLERQTSLAPVSGGPNSTVPFDSQTMRSQFEDEMRTVLFPKSAGRTKKNPVQAGPGPATPGE